jgi:coenzyme F420-0:L-glutamate ligase/coenzyme F420-1:gamma-L-glutamate ligase
MNELRVAPVEGLPEFREGMAVGAEIAASASLLDGDVLVVSQKIVSKAEGRLRRLTEVSPSPRALELAGQLDKDPALVELILGESAEVLRAERGVLIVETRHGFVCANAGIDGSNVPDEDTICLLPEDPDASARQIRREVTPAIAPEPKGELGGPSPQLSAESPLRPPSVAVVIADSFGRTWRLGQTEVAIGCAGLIPLDDWRGRADTAGRELKATAIAVADEAAAAADLVRGKADGVPAAVIRGLDRYVTVDDGPGAAALRRPSGEDLFR